MRLLFGRDQGAWQIRNGEDGTRRGAKTSTMGHSFERRTTRPGGLRSPDTSTRQTLARQGDAEMLIGAARGDPASTGALYQAALQEVRLVDVLDRVARLA